MKSNIKYIISSLFFQMIVVPVVFTILFIFFMQFFGKANPNIDEMLYICTGFALALIIGVVAGALFAGLSKKMKPQTSKARYIPLLIPIIYMGIFVLLFSILGGGDITSVWFNLIIYKSPAFWVIDFILSFYGLLYALIFIELLAYIGFILGFFLQDTFSKQAIRNKTALLVKSIGAVACALLIVLSYASMKDIISSRLLEIQYGNQTIQSDLTQYDLGQMAPFKADNGLATLDNTASLQFNSIDEMPRLDGATAAFPVYASFVQAVYTGLGDYIQANKVDNAFNDGTAFDNNNNSPNNIVKCTTTANAYTNLIDGKTDIIFVAGPSKAELDAVKAKGEEFVLTPIASEAFVFFTNVENPVKKLTVAQIQGIYSGKITNWNKVGGKFASILPFQRPEDSGSQTIMESKVMKDIKMLTPKKDTISGTMGEVIVQVADYKNANNAIGYSFLYYSSSMVKSNSIKYIAVNGILPTTETVRNKTYPFTIPVYAVKLKSNNNQNVQKMIDWVLSDEGQQLIRKTGYVSIK
jgi:phosphate transport system substrate-binding protein